MWACGQASGLSTCPGRTLLVHGVKINHLVSIWMPKMRTASPLFPGWRAKPTRVAITSKMMRRYACFMPLIILSRPEKALRLNFAGGYLLIQLEALAQEVRPHGTTEAVLRQLFSTT